MRRNEWSPSSECAAYREHEEAEAQQAEIVLDKRAKLRLERREKLVAAYDKAIPLAKKYDKWIMEGGKLWAEMSTLLNEMNANRAYPSNVHDNSIWFIELYISQLLAQQGFGTKQTIGGTPDKVPLEQKLKDDREIILNELN